MKNMKQYKIVTASGKQLFGQTYTESAAERIWQSYNGVYTWYSDDGKNDKEEYIYIEEA